MHSKRNVRIVSAILCAFTIFAVLNSFASGPLCGTKWLREARVISYPPDLAYLSIFFYFVFVTAIVYDILSWLLFKLGLEQAYDELLFYGGAEGHTAGEMPLARPVKVLLSYPLFLGLGFVFYAGWMKAAYCP